MDPNALVRRMKEALAEGAYDEALLHYEDLMNWKRSGGFAPAGGWPKRPEVRS